MKQSLSEEMRKYSNVLTESKLIESTLTKLIGNDPGGQDLARWLHQHEKLSNTADFGEISKKTGRVQWQMFKNHPDQFLIVSGPNAVVAIKPEDYDPEEKDRSRDGTLVYHVVAFNKGGERIDNKLIPPPQEKEFTVGRGAGAKTDTAAYQKALAKWKASGDKEIPKDSAPSKISTTTRGGMPFKPDPRGPHNIFDTMREVLGGIDGVFASLSHVGDMDKKDVKGYVDKYQPGQVPAKEIEPDWSDPEQGTRKHGGVERDKIALRNPEEDISLSQELIKASKRMGPVFRKVGKPVIVRLQKSASRYKTKGDEAKAAEFQNAVAFVKNVIDAAENPERMAEFGSLSHPPGKVLANALLKAAELDDPEDIEFKKYLQVINGQGNSTDLKQAMDVLRAELQAYAKEG